MFLTTGVALALAVVCTACLSHDPDAYAAASDDPSMSIIQVLANPAVFDGRRVMIEGYLRLDYADCVLYLHETDFTERLLTNSVWIEVPEEVRVRSAEFSGRHVTIEGVFDASFRGFSGTCSGTLRNVTRIMTLGDGPISTYPDSMHPVGDDPFAPQP